LSVFTKTVRVPYSADDAFDLISDVRRYPEFIRWITAMHVTGEAPPDNDTARCLAIARVGFRGFSERFSTRVTIRREAGHVRADLVDGPFRRLQTDWQITPARGGADIGLTIDYQFKSRLLDLFARANMDMAADRIFKAFLDEAARRYPEAERQGPP
jgi:coenzyme Q-binding protein COQ10